MLLLERFALEVPFDERRYYAIKAKKTRVQYDVKLLWVRAQNDKTLMKALMASVGILQAGNSWDKVRDAIDFSLHFPEFVRYTEGGHGLILDEINAALQALVENGQQDLALRGAQYALERAQEVAENFEDDGDWSSSSESLSKWTEGLR